MTKITVEIPNHVYRAMMMICDKFEVPLDEFVSIAIEGDIQASIDNQLVDYTKDLCDKLKEAIDEE